MRPRRSARWLACAIALSSLAPQALADADPPAKKKKKAVSDCARFDERAVDAGLELSIASSCAARLQCSIRWEVTCAPDTAQARTTKEAAAFELDQGQSGSATASAARCEDDSWEIASISWSCDPM